MWHSIQKLAASLFSLKRRRAMLCGTPFMRMHQNDPTFYIRCIYRQDDGSTIVEDLYPYDGRQEIRVVPKEIQVT